MKKKNKCTHFWIIDSDNYGRCKYCGAEKDFARKLRHYLGEDATEKASRGGKRAHPPRVEQLV